MSGSATGNADQIGGLLMTLADIFDLTRPGATGSLAEDLLDAFALGVIDRTLGGMAADGSALAPNRGEYGARKDAAGLPVGIGLGGGGDRMLSLLQVRGERTITPDLAEVRYGVSTPARDKASYFTYGSSGSGVRGEYSGATGQPERPFWGFDAEIEAAIEDLCEKHLADTLDSLG
jgi:hypothetical protein